MMLLWRHLLWEECGAWSLSFPWQAWWGCVFELLPFKIQKKEEGIADLLHFEQLWSLGFAVGQVSVCCCIARRRTTQFTVYATSRNVVNCLRRRATLFSRHLCAHGLAFQGVHHSYCTECKLIQMLKWQRSCQKLSLPVPSHLPTHQQFPTLPWNSKHPKPLPLLLSQPPLPLLVVMKLAPLWLLPALHHLHYTIHTQSMSHKNYHVNVVVQVKRMFHLTDVSIGTEATHHSSSKEIINFVKVLTFTPSCVKLTSSPPRTAGKKVAEKLPEKHRQVYDRLQPKFKPCRMSGIGAPQRVFPRQPFTYSLVDLVEGFQTRSKSPLNLDP